MCAVAVKPYLVGRKRDGLVGGFERPGEITSQDEVVSYTNPRSA